MLYFFLKRKKSRVCQFNSMPSCQTNATGLHVVVCTCAHNVNKHGQRTVRTIWAKKGYLMQYFTTVPNGTRPNSQLNYPHPTLYTLTSSMTTVHTMRPQTLRTPQLIFSCRSQLKYPYLFFPLRTALCPHLTLLYLITFKIAC